MPVISINSNTSSLQTQRSLARTTKSLEEGYTRLSSGLRINRASDDAAGLAIASNLDADSKVFQQGIRNFNDGISALAIAEGALTEMSNIVTRQSELAEQAANGVYSPKQRLALHREAVALTDEFNRIVDSTEFNSTQLFSLNQSTVSLQGGYGTNGSIGFSIGGELDQTIGLGTMNAATTFVIGITPRATVAGDFNKDGHYDFIAVNDTTDQLTVKIGAGDGSFSSGAAINSVANNTNELVAADFNNDGNLDLIQGNGTSSTTILLGNGDGTFRSGTGVIQTTSHLDTGDFNNDGKLDIFGSNNTSNGFIQFGNGDGTFTAMSTVLTGLVVPLADVTTGDLNLDGNLDLITTANGGVGFALGNGNGTFRAAVSMTTGIGTSEANVVDFNRDGYLDIATCDTSAAFGVFLNNGDGTYGARVSFATSSGQALFKAVDFTGDGLYDLVSLDSSGNVTVLAGIGDGTFNARISSSISIAIATSAAFADFNEDGALDVAGTYAGAAALNVAMQKTTVSTHEDSYYLMTQTAAADALTNLKATQQRVNSERGAIGAYQSRISSGVSVLTQLNESYVTAKSQITDSDVAYETAQLVRNKILQQAGAAVLAQANQAPSIALELLKNPSSP